MTDAAPPRCLPGVPWVESPFFEAFAAELPDDETRRVARSLHDDGLAVVTFPEPDLDEIADRLWIELAPYYAGNRQEWGAGKERVRDAWQTHDSVKRLATNPGILELLRALYGREPFPFQTMNFRNGSEQGAHVDALHFHSVPERFMVGVWLALEDTDEENGPLVYYPGSHKLPFYSNEHVGAPAASPKDPYTSIRHYDTLYRELIRVHRLERREFHAQKGQAAIWAANLIHGGAKQRDPSRSRHSQVTHYFFKGCSYYTPFSSLPFTGGISFRLPMDIRTGVQQENTVNDIPVPPEVMDAAIRAADGSDASQRSGLNVSSLRHLFAPRHVPPNGLQVDGECILLHPNPAGSPPTTLVIDGIPLRGERALWAVIEVASERSETVVFGIEIHRFKGKKITRRTYRVEGGRKLEAHLELPNNLSRCRLTLTTEMARGAKSSEYAWARFARLRFCPAEGAR